MAGNNDVMKSMKNDVPWNNDNGGDRLGDEEESGVDGRRRHRAGRTVSVVGDRKFLGGNGGN